MTSTLRPEIWFWHVFCIYLVAVVVGKATWSRLEPKLIAIN